VDLRTQYQAFRPQIIEEIDKALDGMQLFLGPNVRAFDHEFARYCDTEFGIGVGSGTEALHLALRACGIGPGDEVITVANTFFATFEAIVLAGATPVFVDIEPDTYNMDASQLESKITRRTKAILPVHLYGHPADMDPILEVARNYGLRVVEDACQAHGAEYKGRRAGSMGDAGCFSFYYSKNLGAYGEAGMIVTSDAEIAERCGMLRNHGQDVRYYHPVVGVNGRLDELQAAILRIKLPHLDKWNQSRRDLAQAYRDNLLSSVVLPLEKPWAKHVYHLFVIRTESRDELKSYLEADGIATGIHYPVPIHMQRAYRDCSNGEGPSLPITEEVVRQIISLPIYPELSISEAQHVCRRVREFLDGSESTLAEGARRNLA
jgi:dTDP-4-amino-4,6-dideoxygalactose transaminase